MAIPVQVRWAPGADLSADPATWVWQDITADVRQASPVTITVGRGDEAATTQPSSCNFQLNNPVKAYSAYDPGSPNYPNVRRNTPVQVLSGESTRFFGYINGFPQSTLDVSGKVPVVSVTASGLLRRLQQGKSPLRSPLFRAITAQGTLRSYWPMEDAQGATSFASGLPNGQPMTVTGVTNFAADSSEPGSQPLPTLTDTSSFTATVSGTFSGQFQVDWYYKINDPEPNEVEILRFYTTCTGSDGRPLRFSVIVGNPSFPDVFGLRIFDSSGTLVSDNAITLPAALFGQWVHARVMVQQDGGNISWLVDLFPLIGTGEFFSGTLAGTVGAPTTLTIPAQPAAAGLVTGHWAVFDDFNLGAADQAQSGFTGENVVNRLNRLCREEGVPIEIVGTSTTTMGPQGADTFLNLLRECETTDLGLLYDGVGPGLRYLTRSQRYNATAALTLDASQGQVAPPFTPTDDDQRNRNLVKVSRKNGSSATFEDVDGPLGTAAIGVYDDSKTVNHEDDSQLANYAAWLVRQGTVEGFRYPTLGLDFRAHPELVDAWLATPLNGRIDVVKVSAATGQHSAGDVALLLEGYTETISPFAWTVTANTSPYEPWLVGILGSTFRVAPAGQTVAADVTPGATSLTLATASGFPLFTTNPGDFPMFLDVGGWQIRVTAVSGGTSPQTLTADATLNTVTIPAGTAVKLWKPSGLAL